VWGRDCVPPKLSPFVAVWTTFGPLGSGPKAAELVPCALWPVGRNEDQTGARLELVGWRSCELADLPVVWRPILGPTHTLDHLVLGHNWGPQKAPKALNLCAHSWGLFVCGRASSLGVEMKRGTQLAGKNGLPSKQRKEESAKFCSKHNTHTHRPTRGAHKDKAALPQASRANKRPNISHFFFN